MENTASVLILGIGNLLWADEGFGVRVVEALQQRYEFPEHVKIIDGGTQGLYLIDYVREADVLIVIDAVDYGLEPGSIKCVEGEKVPNFLGAKKVSLHQTGFQEVLALARMMDDYPEHLILLGVQPADIEDYGGSLRPQVKEQIPAIIQLTLDYLARFNITLQPRKLTPEKDIRIQGEIADMALYEQGRPSETEACRKGDARILYSDDFEVARRTTVLDGKPVNVNLDQHLDKYR